MYGKPPRPQRLRSAIFCKFWRGDRLKKFWKKISEKSLIWEKNAYIWRFMISYDIIFFLLQKRWFWYKKADFSILNHVKAQVCHFLQILKRGSSQKILKKNFRKIADLREKCVYMKIYDIIWYHFFPSSKTLILIQKSGFFDPKSRSSVGGFPYKCRDFIIEIIKENWWFEWIWLKIVKL